MTVAFYRTGVQIENIISAEALLKNFVKCITHHHLTCSDSMTPEVCAMLRRINKNTLAGHNLFI